MIISNNRRWVISRFVLRYTYLTVIALFSALLLTGCSWFSDDHHRPVVSADGQRPIQNQTAHPSQPANHVPQAGPDAKPTPGDYIVYDPTHPMADEYGIVRLNRNKQVRKDKYEYTVYDPEHPGADKNGFVHLRVRGPDASTSKSATGKRKTDTLPNQTNISRTNDSFTRVKTPESAAGSPSARPVVSNVTVTEVVPAKSPTIPTESAVEPIKNITAVSLVSSTVPTDITAPPAAPSVVPTDTTTAPQGYSAIPTNATDTAVAPPTPLTTGTSTTVTNAGLKTGGVTQPSVTPRLSARPAAIVQPSTTQQINRVVADLERYITLNPDDMKIQTALRLLYSVSGSDQKALEYLPSMSMEKQAQMLALTRAVLLAAGAGRADGQNQAEAANLALEALTELTGKIAEKADLTIAGLKICEEVTGFGQYKQLDKELLRSGQARRVLVYCELKNFTTRLNAEGKHYTNLHADISLFDSSYKTIARINRDVPDTPIYNKRRDFYLHGWLDLPRLSPGPYEIVVTIEDKFAHKIARAVRYKFDVTARSDTPAMER